MYTANKLKDLMKTHPAVRPNVQGLVDRVIDEYYGEIVAQLGDVPPLNSPVNLMMTSIDDSGSMGLREKDAPEGAMLNGELIVNGYNRLVNALKHSTAQHRTMVSAAQFNRGVVHPFVHMLDVPEFTLVHTKFGTPLYRATMIGLVVLLVKSAILLEESGIRSSTTLLIMSDGVNYGDSSFTAAQVKQLVESMLLSRRVKHKIIAIGVSNPQSPNYDELFASMGVPAGDSHTADKNEHSLRQLFGEVTTSIEQHAANGLGAGEMIGGPTGGHVVVEEETENLGALPGYPARDGTTTHMEPGVEPWQTRNFGGWA